MRRAKLILSAFGLFLSAGVSAYATSVDFTFDSQTINGTVINGLGSGATPAQIQAYMNAVLTAAGCTGCSAVVLAPSTVSGTSSTIGAVGDQTYNGENNVTGPGTAPGDSSKSLTLGDSNGATASTTTSTINSSNDTFIANTNDSSGTVSNQITIQFKGITGLSINSFDYEIFPDGTCTALTTANCGGAKNGSGIYPNQPDLEFEAGTNTNGTDTAVTTLYGITPGSGSDGNAVKSPNSSNQLAPQLIGTWTGTGSGNNIPLTGVTELDFVDWPATIGIDNLQISYNTPAVPEPSAIVLFGTLVLFLGKKLRKA